MTKLNKIQRLGSHREHLSQSNATSAAYQRCAVCCWARRDSNQKDYKFGLWSLPWTLSKTELDWKHSGTAGRWEKLVGRSRGKEEGVQALCGFCRAACTPHSNSSPQGTRKGASTAALYPLCPGNGQDPPPPAKGTLLAVEGNINQEWTWPAGPGLAYLYPASPRVQARRFWYSTSE